MSQNATHLSSYRLLSFMFRRKIASSTEATISAVGILLGAIAKLRPCSIRFLCSSVNSLEDRLITHLLSRFES